MAEGERELVRWLQQQSGPPKWPVVLGIGDDMGIVEVAGSGSDQGSAVLVTSDMLLDGVHFETGAHPLDQIGRKAIACSLSDCAAMAARPLAATVSVGLPAATTTDEAKQLFKGLRQMAEQFDCALIGGDMTGWRSAGGRLTIDVAMIAAQYPGQPPIRRSGARVGDTLYVTGPLGGSRLSRHLTFTPRVHEARQIAAATGQHLHAMMDISDGLSLDLHRLCEASDIGAELAKELLEPVISDDARRAADQDGRSPLDHALNDGEDFELLLAVGGDAPEPPAIEDAYLHPVGTVVADGVSIKRRDGSTSPLVPGGWEHLK